MKGKLLQTDARFRRGERWGGPEGFETGHVFDLFDSFAVELESQEDFGTLVEKDIPAAVFEIWKRLWWWTPRAGDELQRKLLQPKIQEWQGRLLIAESQRVADCGSSTETAAESRGPEPIDMNLTPRQENLLVKIVDGDRAANGGGFTVLQTRSGGGLGFGSQPPANTDANLDDVRRLLKEEMVDGSEVQQYVFSGGPTQKGIDAAEVIRSRQRLVMKSGLAPTPRPSDEKATDSSPWVDIFEGFQVGILRFPDLAAHWESRQELWTLLDAPVGEVERPGAPEALTLFKQSARLAIAQMGYAGVDSPPWHTWLNLMRSQKRGFRRTLKPRTWTETKALLDSEVPTDTAHTPLSEDGEIHRVFQESSEFCSDLAVGVVGTPPATAGHLAGAAAHAENPGEPESRPGTESGLLATAPDPADYGVLVPGTEKHKRGQEAIEAFRKAEEAGPELRRRHQREAADLNAMYARRKGRNGPEFIRQEEVIQGARSRAEGFLAEAHSPADRKKITGKIWDSIPRHADADAFRLTLDELHAAVWTEGYPSTGDESLEDRANNQGVALMETGGVDGEDAGSAGKERKGSLGDNADLSLAVDVAADVKNRDVDLLGRIVAETPTTVEKWAKKHKLGRTTVFDWMALRASGKPLKGKVSTEKASIIEQAIRADARELGLIDSD